MGVLSYADVPSSVIWPQIQQRYALERCYKQKQNVTICFATDRVANKRVVLKIVDCRIGTAAANRSSIRQEAKILASVDHPNIIKLIEFYESIDEVRFFFSVSYFASQLPSLSSCFFFFYCSYEASAPRYS